MLRVFKIEYREADSQEVRTAPTDNQVKGGIEKCRIIQEINILFPFAI